MFLMEKVFVLISDLCMIDGQAVSATLDFVADPCPTLVAYYRSDLLITIPAQSRKSINLSYYKGILFIIGSNHVHVNINLSSHALNHLIRRNDPRPK